LLQQQQQGVRHTSELPFRDFHHQDQILLTQRGEEVDHHLQLQHTFCFAAANLGFEIFLGLKFWASKNLFFFFNNPSISSSSSSSSSNQQQFK
jgi:hypothetical protein